MELNVLITRIVNLQQELAGFQPLKSDVQEKLHKKFRLEFNYNSNHIEGNTLTYGETELYLIFDKTTGNHDGREYEEMRASDAALKMIQEYAADKERPLTEAFIKSLNELILVRPYWVDAITPAGQPTRRQIIPGGYKKQPNSVRLQNGEMFHYTSPEETPIQMGELVAWYTTEVEKNELHPVALAALLHYKFVRIHPFDDGNGRISRLLMNYVLYANGLPPVVVKSADKKNYLFALNQADAGDINAFVEYIARQLVWSLELSIKAAKGENIEERGDLEKEIEVWKKELKGKVPNDSIEKNDVVIRNVYLRDIRPTVEMIAQNINSLRELFIAYFFTGAVNTNHNKNSDGLTLIDSLFADDMHALKSIKEEDESLDRLDFIFHFNAFTRKPHNPFNARLDLQVNFNIYNYSLAISVSSKRKHTYRKAYDEPITESEKRAIADLATRELFNYIKSQTEP